MIKLACLVAALLLSGCANVSGPCMISTEMLQCREGGSITIISTDIKEVLKK